MEEDQGFTDDEQIVLEDSEDSGVDDASISGIIPFVMERYKRADDYRQQDEDRWLRSYRNYRGIYGSDVQFTEAEKSRVFIKVTKTKTLAAYGQIVDVLFGSNKFPISINPTVLPEGITDTVNFETDSNMRKAQESVVLHQVMIQDYNLVKQLLIYEKDLEQSVIN